MEVLGNSNCIMHIISNMLKMQNPKLVDHGSRVGYIVAKMLEIQERPEEEIIRSYLLGLLHDVGAYKTEEIDKLVQFETKDVHDHSIYGYLILKLSEVMKDSVDAILYHHTPWEQLKSINTENRQLANLIFLADRVEIYLRCQGEAIELNELKKTGNFSEENLELFRMAEEKFNLQKRVLDGSYINDTEKYLYRAGFDDDELKRFIRMVAFLIDFRSESTVTHTITMVSTGVELARLLNLDEQQQDEIYTGSYIHDLGKVAIPLEILEKPGALTEDEFEVMKTHILHTGTIIRGHVSDNVYKLAMRHHEKLDGKGYPYGIRDEEMTTAEKIVAVADIFSALSGKRSYKEGFPKEKIISIMQQMAERGQISQEVVSILIENYDMIIEKIDEECSQIIHNYEEIKERYQKIKKILKNESK